MTQWLESRLWHQIHLSARPSSASSKVCYWGHIIEPLEALDSLSSYQSSCEDQTRELRQGHKHSTWHSASTQHRISALITKKHFCISCSHLSLTYSGSWYYSLGFMNEILKLICLVLCHQQEIKLSFKSIQGFIYGCAEDDLYNTNYNKPCLVCLGADGMERRCTQPNSNGRIPARPKVRATETDY